MTLRSWLVRIMLAFLAVAALGGIGGIFVPGEAGVWKLVGTAVTTSVCCALLLAATRFIDRPERRLASYYAMAVILVEFILSLACWWNVAELFFPAFDATWRVLAAMGCIAMTQFPAGAFATLPGRPNGRIAGWFGIVGLGIALAILLSATFSGGGSSSPADELWPLGMIMVPFVIVTGVCLIGAGPGDRRYWRWLGVAGSIAAYTIIVFAILGKLPHQDVLPRSIVWTASIGAVVAFANIALYATLTSGQQWLRVAAIACMAATAVMLDFVLVEKNPPELLTRLAAAAGICTACGSTAIAILARVNKRAAAPRVTPREITHVDLTCPHCTKRQRLPLGESACGNCGLWITVRVDEPRCETCGYLLYMLRGERCPECGTRIPPRGAPVGARLASPAAGDTSVAPTGPADVV